jgi:alpha-galactosidase
MRCQIKSIVLAFALIISILSQDIQAQVYTPVENPSNILTPKPSPKPRINGAKIFGVRPGSPFLYTIPVTGIRPMIFSVDDLPQGLNLDSDTGLITGSLDTQGNYIVTITATNALGTANREFRIVVGNKISLTPPLGWNSWNCYGHDVSAEGIYANAKAMVETGLINHGWSYINIDVGWQSGKRGGKYHAIIPNANVIIFNSHLIVPSSID